MTTLRQPPGRREVETLLARHGVRPQKRYGQNFVTDPNLVRRVARAAGLGPGDAVLEVGPGLGALSLALRAEGADVRALELDRALLPALAEVLAGSGVEVREGDILSVDLADLLAGRNRWLVVANLPYNVATPAVLRILEEAPQVRELFVMVQREVADRFAAAPSSKAYGAVTVKIAAVADVERLFNVSPDVFWPRPTVESALVRIRRRPGVPWPGRAFRLVVEAAFAHRRKTLRRALAHLGGAALCVAADLSGEERAETLDVAAFHRLAAAYSAQADA